MFGGSKGEFRELGRAFSKTGAPTCLLLRIIGGLFRSVKMGIWPPLIVQFRDYAGVYAARPFPQKLSHPPSPTTGRVTPEKMQSETRGHEVLWGLQSQRKQ